MTGLAISAGAIATSHLRGGVPPTPPEGPFDNWVVIRHITAPVDGVFDVRGLDLGGYDRVRLEFDRVTVDVISANVEVHLQAYVNGLLKSPGSHAWRHHGLGSSGTDSDTSSAAGTAIRLAGGSGASMPLDEDANAAFSGRVDIDNLDDPTLLKTLEFDLSWTQSNALQMYGYGAGLFDHTEAMDGFFVSGIDGKLLAGTLTIYGLVPVPRTPNPPSPDVLTLWVGDVTTDSIAVVVNLTMDAEVRLAISTSSGMTSPTYGSLVATTNHRAKLAVSGLAAGTAYYCAVEVDGVLDLGSIGRFTTLDAAATTLLVAFSGDADTGSDHAVFDQIRAEAPAFFIHLGDAHYRDISTGAIGRFLSGYDDLTALAKQEQLRRELPNWYLFDDHDFGPNDAHAASGTQPYACQAYRRVVPHPPLQLSGDTDGVYFAREISVGGIGVIFVATDQRSYASNKTATDNSSKTILGTTQKTWFKGLFSNAANDSKLFVWLCSRTWGGVASVGADHWGGFTTERTELADHFKAEAPGRVVVLSADMHSLAIDSGANHNFATGGGDPLPTFQAAPLDRVGAETHGGATYDQGSGRYTHNNQYGLMLLTKTGASQITMDWTGKRHTGATLVTYQKVFNL